MALHRPKRALASAEDGTATVETVIMLPIFLTLLMLVVDVTMVFYGQSAVLRVVQDANRALAIRRITTVEETEALVRAGLPQLDGVMQVDSAIDAGIVTTQVQVPANALQILHAFDYFNGVTVRVSAQHYIEM